MAKSYRNITPELVAVFRGLFSYNPVTGILTSKNGSCQKNIGDAVGSISRQSGYVKITYKRKLYQGHRVCWAIHYNEVPPDEIDHKDTVRHHNWIDNLREATSSTNKANKFFHKNNTSGYKGVSLFKRTGRYRATIAGRIHIGYFDTPEQAAVAYDAELISRYGEFARTNFGDQK